MGIFLFLIFFKKSREIIDFIFEKIFFIRSSKIIILVKYLALYVTGIINIGLLII